MANSIEYIYTIIDRYSAPLKQITNATKRFKTQANEATKAMQKMAVQFERLPVNMRNFKRTIGSPVSQTQIKTLKEQTGGIARNIDQMGKASGRFAIIDRYSAPLKQITNATKRFKTQANEATKAMQKMAVQFERLPVNMRNFKRTIGSPVFQTQIKTLKEQTGGIARNIDQMGKASGRFAIQSKALRAGRTAMPMGGAGRAGGLAQIGALPGAMAGLGGMVGGAAIAGGMFSFAKAASDMQDAMADVARVTGLTGPQLKRMQDSLQALGRATGRSAIGLAEIAYQGGKLGIANDQMEMFVGTVMKTAVAFDMVDAEAGRAIGSIRAKLGLSVQSVDTLLQRVNYLADTTAADGAQMINIIERTSGTFGALEIPPEVIAGWAAYANQIETTQELAASGLNQMMIRLIQMPGMLEKMLADPKGSVIAFLQQLKGMDKLKRSAAIIKMFGLEASRFVMKAVDKVDLLNATMDKAASTKALGSMDREFQNYLKRSSTAAKRVSQTFMDIKRSIGEVFLATFDKYVPLLLKLQEGILKFVKNHESLVKVGMAFGAIAVALAAVIVPFGILAAMVGAAIPLFTALAGVQLAVLWPWALIAAGVVAAMAAFAAFGVLMVNLWEKSGAFKQSILNLIDAFSPLTDALWEIFQMIGHDLGLAFGDNAKSVKWWGDQLAYYINGVAAIIRTFMNAFIGQFRIAAGLMTGDWSMAWEGVKQTVGLGTANEKAKSRQDNKLEFSGKIDVSASGGAKVKTANINLNQGSNLAMAH